MSIPTPPNISDEEEDIKVPSSIGIKNIQELPCTSLSKKACGINRDCEYSDIDNKCIPRAVKDKYEYEEYLFKSTRKWRENVMSWIDRPKGDCDIESFMKNIHVYSSGKGKEKDTASSSIIISGLVTPTKADSIRGAESNVIIKASYPSKNPVDNSLSVEKAIYENIITKLVNERNTPGVISYLGTMECKGDPVLPSTELKKYTNEKYALAKSSLINDSVTFLYLERSTGITLIEFILKKIYSFSDILTIIFIIIYTLMCFANIGLRHNDLHFKNIFIEDAGKPISLFFRLEENKVIQVRTRYIPKIYDFDYSSIPYIGVPRNLNIDRDCSITGRCNSYNPKFDLHTFLCILKFRIPEFSANIGEQLDRDILKKIISDDLCYIGSRRALKKFLDYNQFPTDTELLPHEKILELLYITMWDNNPFSVLVPPANIPHELLFTPPINILKKKYYMERPVSVSQNRAVDIEFLQKLGNERLGQKFIEINIDIWIDEIMSEYKYNINELSDILTKKIVNIMSSETIQISDRLINWIRAASLILCCYQYHSLDQNTACKIVDEKLYTLISHIWNMFNNKLPIEIPMCRME